MWQGICLEGISFWFGEGGELSPESTESMRHALANIVINDIII